jgi:hypothetical protein
MIRPVVGAAADVACHVVTVASSVVIEAVMLVTNVSDGIVASMTGLSDAGRGDRRRGDDRHQSKAVARLHR